MKLNRRALPPAVAHLVLVRRQNPWNLAHPLQRFRSLRSHSAVFHTPSEAHHSSHLLAFFLASSRSSGVSRGELVRSSCSARVASYSPSLLTALSSTSGCFSVAAFTTSCVRSLPLPCSTAP